MSDEIKVVEEIMNQKRDIKISNPDILKKAEFPRSSKYDPRWILENQMGPHPLWLLEWLMEEMKLRPGMRVLDMGCGRALTGVFLAKEYGVEVWANDLWVSPNMNRKTIAEAGMEKRIFPIRAEAHQLPYAEEFFDAVISIDSFQYYGTADNYMARFHRYLKPGAQIGIVVPSVKEELSYPLPEHLIRQKADGSVFWDEECWTFHSPEWWARHWKRHPFLKFIASDWMPDGCRLWREWEEIVDEANAGYFPSEAETLREDDGRFLGFARVIAKRN